MGTAAPTSSNAGNLILVHFLQTFLTVLGIDTGDLQPAALVGTKHAEMMILADEPSTTSQMHRSSDWEQKCYRLNHSCLNIFYSPTVLLLHNFSLTEHCSLKSVLYNFKLQLDFQGWIVLCGPLLPL